MEQVQKIIDKSRSIKLYANGLSINISAFDVIITFLDESRDVETPNVVKASEVATINMSPQLAKTLSVLLGNVISDYETNIGVLPNVDKLTGK